MELDCTGIKMKKKAKKENLFLRLFNRILKLKHLRLFELAIGWVRGFSVKVEFFKEKDNDKESK